VALQADFSGVNRREREVFGDNWFFGLATIRIPGGYFESGCGVGGDGPGGLDWCAASTR